LELVKPFTREHDDVNGAMKICYHALLPWRVRVLCR